MRRRPQKGEECGDSAWYWMEQPAARPENGRPLQNLLPTTHSVFVAAVLSRAIRDGTGILMVKLSHYREEIRKPSPSRLLGGDSGFVKLGTGYRCEGAATFWGTLAIALLIESR